MRLSWTGWELRTIKWAPAFAFVVAGMLQNFFALERMSESRCLFFLQRPFLSFPFFKLWTLPGRLNYHNWLVGCWLARYKCFFCLLTCHTTEWMDGWKRASKEASIVTLLSFLLSFLSFSISFLCSLILSLFGFRLAHSSTYRTHVNSHSLKMLPI